jgi:hypothetical protein
MEPNYDKLVISQGGLALWTFTGSSPAPNATVYDAAGCVVVTFSSDSSTNDLGFVLQYAIANVTVATPTMCANGTVVEVNTTDVSGNISAVMPFGSAPYSNNLVCVWKICTVAPFDRHWPPAVLLPRR